MKLQVYEIFEKFSAASTRKEKISVLQKHNIMPVRDVLQGTFDPKIEWNLPKGKVPYSPAPNNSHMSSLLRQHKKFKFFVKGLRESNNISQIKRERMFLEIIEGVHPRDAEILVDMINKKTSVKGLTAKIVKEAYPDLIRD